MFSDFSPHRLNLALALTLALVLALNLTLTLNLPLALSLTLTLTLQRLFPEILRLAQFSSFHPNIRIRDQRSETDTKPRSRKAFYFVPSIENQTLQSGQSLVKGRPFQASLTNFQRDSLAGLYAGGQ